MPVLRFDGVDLKVRDRAAAVAMMNEINVHDYFFECEYGASHEVTAFYLENDDASEQIIVVIHPIAIVEDWEVISETDVCGDGGGVTWTERRRSPAGVAVNVKVSTWHRDPVNGKVVGKGYSVSPVDPRDERAARWEDDAE